MILTKRAFMLHQRKSNVFIRVLLVDTPKVKDYLILRLRNVIRFNINIFIRIFYLTISSYALLFCLTYMRPIRSSAVLALKFLL